MPTHHLGRLLRLGINTSYYQDESHKAVCELEGENEDKTLRITLFVDGKQIEGLSGRLEDVLSKGGLRVDGWTTKPGRR